MAIDPNTGEILASALTGTEDDDPIYLAVADRAPGAVVIIPPLATAVTSDAAAAGAPTPRDRHIEMIAAKGRIGWQKGVSYGR